MPWFIIDQLRLGRLSEFVSVFFAVDLEKHYAMVDSWHGEFNPVTWVTSSLSMPM